MAGKLLHTSLRRDGSAGRVRSPAALWSLLRQGLPLVGTKWRRLLFRHNWADLLEALARRRTASGTRLASWNVRWLVSPHTEQAAAKRAVIRRWLDVGRVVLLQETHWVDADAVVWASLFPAATLCYAPATIGRQGGPSGGVAILFPLGIHTDPDPHLSRRPRP